MMFVTVERSLMWVCVVALLCLGLPADKEELRAEVLSRRRVPHWGGAAGFFLVSFFPFCLFLCFPSIFRLAGAVLVWTSRPVFSFCSS